MLYMEYGKNLPNGFRGGVVSKCWRTTDAGYLYNYKLTYEPTAETANTGTKGKRENKPNALSNCTRFMHVQYMQTEAIFILAYSLLKNESWACKSVYAKIMPHTTEEHYILYAMYMRHKELNIRNILPQYIGNNFWYVIQ